MVLLTKIAFSQVNADLHQVYANLVYLHSGLCRFTPTLQVCFHLMYIRNVKMCRDLRSKRFFYVFIQNIGIDVDIPFNI